MEKVWIVTSKKPWSDETVIESVHATEEGADEQLRYFFEHSYKYQSGTEWEVKAYDLKS